MNNKPFEEYDELGELIEPINTKKYKENENIICISELNKNLIDCMPDESVETAILDDITLSKNQLENLFRILHPTANIIATKSQQELKKQFSTLSIKQKRKGKNPKQLTIYNVKGELIGYCHSLTEAASILDKSVYQIKTAIKNKRQLKSYYITYRIKQNELELEQYLKNAAKNNKIQTIL